MTHAYQEMYLSNAQALLGDAFDYAINACGISGNDFVKLFSVSSVSKRIENGEPAYLAGKSGIEVVEDILVETTGKAPTAKPQVTFSRSREYWIGWAIAYYQWFSGRKFGDIFKVLSFEDLLQMYAPLHEADISKFADIADSRMRAYFSDAVNSYHVKTFRDAMEEVASGKADYAVLPIENSTEGIVTDIYDLLTEYQLYIVGEQGVKVEHVLLGIPETSLDEIKTVYSHPQALAQCKKYLESHPDWKIVKTENTAGAAKKVHEEMNRSQAAIASRAAGELYGLSVMAENICYNDQNVTRFIIVSAHPVYEKSAAKVSVCFELPHESGTLYNMLSHFIYNGLSMTKIESRPITGKKWEYRFFVDFEGNLEEPAVKNALRGLEAEANRMRVLGNYGQQEEQ